MCNTTFFQRVLPYGILVLLCVSPLSAQRKSATLPIIEWSTDGISPRIESSGVYAYTSFEVFDDGQTVAFLSTNAPEIILYDIQQPSARPKHLALPEEADEMTYSDGKFYVVSSSKAYCIDRMTGNVEQVWDLQNPSGGPLTIYQIRKVGSQLMVLTADESTYALTSKGLIRVDAENWWLTASIKGRTEKMDNSRFKLNVELKENRVNKEISIAKLGLSGELGTVILCGVSGHNICLDVEMTCNQQDADVQRFLLFLDKKGKLVSKTAIPLHYYTYARRDLSFDGNHIYLTTTTERGVYLTKVMPKTELNIPAEIKAIRYHYNEHPPTNNESGEGHGNISSPESGGNCITRTQAWENAYKYTGMSWTATAGNIASTCTLSSGKYYKTPIWVTAGAKSSIPYKWGGWTDWADWLTFVASGRKCGNYATTGNSVCLQPAHDYVSDGTVIGVDCSGFISRVWELSNKYGTSGLPGICTSLGAANSTAGFDSLRVGDIVNTTGHVRLCVTDNPTGTTTFMESSAVDWKVAARPYTRTALTGYTSYRFNSMTDARIRLSQAISLIPSTVNQGCPLTVKYKVRNWGTESWSGEICLVIIQSTGVEATLKTNTVTLAAGAHSSEFEFYTSAVSYPLGSSKLEVRLKNSSMCNYSRYYKAGNGNYANPVAFTIGSNCNNGGPSNDNCASAIYLPVGTTCNNTMGNNTGATASSPAPVGGCPNSNLKDVWFHFYMPNVQNPLVTIRTTAGSMNDGVMEVYQGNSCSALAYITCEDDNSNGNGSYMPVIGLQGGPNNHIWVRLWGYNGAVGSFNICVFNYQSNNLTGGGNGTTTYALNSDQIATIEREVAFNSGAAIPRKDMRDSVEIYPNPGQDRVNISFNQYVDCTEMSYFIYNPTGNVVAKKSISHSEPGWRTEQINTSNWPQGLYTVQLSTCAGNYTEKLVIIRN